MSMKKIKTEAVEKSSWWYWFKKSDDGNIATCNNCDWTKERGTARSTSILRCHLKAKHPELYLEKVEADGNTQKVGKLGLKRKKEGTSAMEEESEDNEDELNEEVQDRLSFETIDSNPTVENQQDGGDAAADEMMEEVKLSRDFVSMLSNITAYSNYNSQQNTIPSTSMSSFPSLVAGASSNFNSLQSTKQNQTSSKSLKTANNNYIKQQIVPQQIVKLCRIESFSSAHRLHNPKFDLALNKEIYGKCNNPNGHGHNYTWKVVIEGPVNAETGMVYNLADLKQEMAEVMEEVDHKNLDKDVAYFRDNGIVSTTENLAIFLYNKLAERMRNPELLKKVVVYETDKNNFSYTGHR